MTGNHRLFLKTKEVESADIVKKILADYANYKGIRWDYTHVDNREVNGTDVLTIMLGLKEDGTYRKYHFDLLALEQTKDILDSINSVIQDYESFIFRATKQTSSRIPAPELSHKEIESLGKSEHYKATEILSKIEDLLLNSDLEWGITCDPKTKAYTICIAEVEE